MSKEQSRARLRFWVRAAATGALLAAGAGVADAKTDPATEAKLAAAQAKIDALTADLQSLTAQVQDLKASEASDVADVRAAAATNQVSISNGRPTIQNADGSQKFAVRGLVQFDATRYIEDDKTQLDLNSGTNFRRARLGIEGTVSKDWSYALTGEFGGSGAEAAQLNQAWVEYGGWRPGFLANPLRLRIGAWAQPANLEDATNNTESLFLERPGVSELNRSIAAGDGRSGIGFNANGDKWYAGGALTGDLVGQGSSSATPVSDEQTGYTARVAYAFLKGPNHALHLGANFNGIIDPQDTGAGPATTKQIRLRERPELRVDDTRLVDTGAINSEGVNSYGGEIGANWKNLYAAGEYFKINLDRSGPLADPDFNGWYVQGAWTLTGEQHQWNAAAGGFRGIRPANEFNPSKNQWGAWELAARYSVLDLNFNEGSVGSAVPASGIRGGEQDISTVGLNFYPNSVVRFLFNLEHADVDKIGAGNAKVHNDFDAVSLRTQVAF